MTRQEAIEGISNILNRIVLDKGENVSQIDEHTVILGGDLPVDSLDLAALVVQLQGVTGNDPFADGFINFRTVGELADLYSS